MTTVLCSICEHVWDDHGDTGCEADCPCDVRYEELPLSNFLQDKVDAEAADQNRFEESATK